TSRWNLSASNQSVKPSQSLKPGSFTRIIHRRAMFMTSEFSCVMSPPLDGRSQCPISASLFIVPLFKIHLLPERRDGAVCLLQILFDRAQADPMFPCDGGLADALDPVGPKHGGNTRPELLQFPFDCA